MARSPYRPLDSSSATMVAELTRSRRPIIHPNVAKTMEYRFPFVGFRLAATFQDVVVHALCCAEWLNYYFSRPFENLGVGEGICGLLDVFDARHVQHIMLS